MKFFREAHPSMKKETQCSEGQKLWNTMKNYSEKLFHGIAKLKAKAGTIKSRNLHMWSSFLKPSSIVVGKPIQIIVQLFSMLEL